MNIPPPHPAQTSPANELLQGKPLVEMTDEELSSHLAKLRATIETPQSLKKALSVAGDSAPKKAAKKADVKAKINSLFD